MDAFLSSFYLSSSLYGTMVLLLKILLLPLVAIFILGQALNTLYSGGLSQHGWRYFGRREKIAS